MEATSLLKARTLSAAALALAGSAVQAQIPDLLSAFDAGGRSLGVGGALTGSTADTRSVLNNPAGLGFTNQKSVGLSLRNMSESRTRISGEFADPEFESSLHSGDRSITHLGYVMPMGERTGLGFSFETAGYLRNTTFGTGLQDGAVFRNNYFDRIRARTDFFTAAVGRTTKSQNQSVGIGLVIANQSLRNNQTYNVGTSAQDPGTPVVPISNAGNTYSVGIVVGGQFIPKGNPDGMFSASLRTPINLNGDADVEDYVRRIPGKVSVGYVQRLGFAQRPQDYILTAFQADYYFGGSSGAILSRDNQFVIGTGIEYNFRFRGGYIPIRLGYRNIGEGGNGFSSVRGFTYGIGYTPDNGGYSVDLSFGRSNGGGKDMSLGLSYRIK